MIKNKKIKGLVAPVLALSLLSLPSFALAENNSIETTTKQESKTNQGKVFSEKEIAAIDKEVDRIFIASKGNKDEVKKFLESKGIKHIKRVSQPQPEKSADLMSTQSTQAYYESSMDFYRIDAYKVKVVANVELTSPIRETSPSSKDRLAISWDSAIQNKSSEVFNFVTDGGKSKSDYSGIMAKAESGTGAMAFSINDGTFYLDYVRSAYVNVTFTDPKSQIGTGPYTTYYTRYKHTYGSGTTSWRVGFPFSIEVNGSTSESIDDYADDLAQYAP